MKKKSYFNKKKQLKIIKLVASSLFLDNLFNQDRVPSALEQLPPDTKIAPPQDRNRASWDRKWSRWDKKWTRWIPLIKKTKFQPSLIYQTFFDGVNNLWDCTVAHGSQHCRRVLLLCNNIFLCQAQPLTRYQSLTASNNPMTCVYLQFI